MLNHEKEEKRFRYEFRLKKNAWKPNPPTKITIIVFFFIPLFFFYFDNGLLSSFFPIKKKTNEKKNTTTKEKDETNKLPPNIQNRTISDEETTSPKAKTSQFQVLDKIIVRENEITTLDLKKDYCFIKNLFLSFNSTILISDSSETVVVIENLFTTYEGNIKYILPKENKKKQKLLILNSKNTRYLKIESNDSCALIVTFWACNPSSIIVFSSKNIKVLKIITEKESDLPLLNFGNSKKTIEKIKLEGLYLTNKNSLDTVFQTLLKIDKCLTK